MFSDTVLGTTVSVALIRKKLRMVLMTKAALGKEIIIERIGENQGFLSITVRLHLDWHGEGAEILPKSLVLKGHISERSFYRLAMKEHLWEVCKLPLCFCAQHFRRNGSESGYLILQDLSSAAVVQPLYAGLREPQVKAVLEQLAILHAFSLTNETWSHGAHKIFRSTFLEVQRVYPEITRARISRAISQLKRDFGEWFVDRNGDCLLNKLAKVVDDQLERYNGEAVHLCSGMQSVLVHGDLWTNNILWQSTMEGESSNNLLSLIDWQNVHAGNVAEDLVRLLGSSVSPKTRHIYLHKFVTYYLVHLSKELRKRGVFTLPFNHRQVIDAYEKMFGQGLLIMLPSLNACADEGNGLLGEENVRERQALVLERTKSLIEDFLQYRKKHIGW